MDKAIVGVLAFICGYSLGSVVAWLAIYDEPIIYSQRDAGVVAEACPVMKGQPQVHSIELTQNSIVVRCVNGYVARFPRL